MDPIRVRRIENRLPRISENYHRVPRIRDIGSPQVHTGYLTFSLKKNLDIYKFFSTFDGDDPDIIRKRSICFRQSTLRNPFL